MEEKVAVVVASSASAAAGEAQRSEVVGEVAN